MITIIRGSVSGLVATNPQHVSCSVGTATEPWSHFGNELAALSLGSGPQSDLAVGMFDSGVLRPGGEFVSRAGLAVVLYGSSSGLQYTGRRIIQEYALTYDYTEGYDAMGAVIAH
jgi:hypothetical protein